MCTVYSGPENTTGSPDFRMLQLQWNSSLIWQPEIFTCLPVATGRDRGAQRCKAGVVNLLFSTLHKAGSQHASYQTPKPWFVAHFYFSPYLFPPSSKMLSAADTVPLPPCPCVLKTSLLGKFSKEMETGPQSPSKLHGCVGIGTQVSLSIPHSKARSASGQGREMGRERREKNGK